MIMHHLLFLFREALSLGPARHSSLVCAHTELNFKSHLQSLVQDVGVLEFPLGSQRPAMRRACVKLLGD